MIKYRRKEYTIPEGHYTGPKDIEEIPGYLETIGKGSAIGAITGGVVGHFKDDSNIIEGAFSGAKYGTISGLIFKFLLNYIHKPMSSIKYQEVDKNIRRQFGIYQISGITVGDTNIKRGRLEDNFSFNDRDVTKYKLNFTVHNNQITMYTFGVSKEELDLISNVLDYYCKKYYSMEYTASIINQKVNSYSVNITFTNYSIVSNFIIELSNKLNSKINLLDNNAIVSSRLLEASEKSFSITKYDLIKYISSGISIGISGLLNGLSSGNSLVNGIQSIILNFLQKNKNELLQQNNYLINKGSYDNSFLKTTLKKLHYIEGYHYSIDSKKTDINISLISGLLVITTTKEISKNFDEKVWNHLKNKIQRKELTGRKVILYLYSLDSISEFEMILNKILSICIPNIFDKEIKLKRR